MTDRVRNRINTERILNGSAWLLLSILVTAILLAGCSGGNNTDPPLTPVASLRGVVTFADNIQLLKPPGDDLPAGIRYGARIIDPGDDIGHAPIPKPSTMGTLGNYEFTQLDPNPLVYLNLLFTIDTDLEGKGETTKTKVGFNIPVSLADSVSSLLSAHIELPSPTVLQMTYAYEGPDGSREIRLRLDFATDLLTFDLDSDGTFDDLITIDVDHDAISDGLAPLLTDLDFKDAFQTYGSVSDISTNTITVADKKFDITEIANMSDPQTKTALALSDFEIGDTVTIGAVPFNGSNIAVKVELLPKPSDKPDVYPVVRAGIIEEIDSTSLTVAGTLFQDYPSAVITNTLGDPVAPSDLKAGIWASVTGTRNGTVIKADKIVIQYLAPPPANIQHEGVIQALDNIANPSSMTLDGLVFELTGNTVVKDISGAILDPSVLKIGDPARVSAHADGTVFVADIIELKFVVDKPNEKKLEVVVLYNDSTKLPEINSAVVQVGSPISIVPVLISQGEDGTPCLDDLWTDFGQARLMLTVLEDFGFIEAYPRVDNGACSVLVLTEDGYPHAISWVNLFFPHGIGGAPLQFDRVVLDQPYGAGPEYSQANLAVTAMDNKLSKDSFVEIYVSPDSDFSG